MAGSQVRAVDSANTKKPLRRNASSPIDSQASIVSCVALLKASIKKERQLANSKPFGDRQPQITHLKTTGHPDRLRLH